MNSDIILSMGTYTYIAKIEKDEEGDGYIVQFPSLRGCLTYGNTVEEAIKMAKEALELYIESLKDEGWPLPKEKKALLKKGSKMDIPLTVSV